MRLIVFVKRTKRIIWLERFDVLQVREKLLTYSIPDDFSARSSDELSLSKGDRVELIERDDDFGDGWYLGRHLINGNSGLFPEG